MKKSSGFILITVLVFVQLFVIFGLFMLENNTLHLKLLYANKNKIILVNRANHLLEILSADLGSLHSCIIPQTDSIHLVKYQLTWWKKMGCSGRLEGVDYYYVVEDLDNDSCYLIQPNRIAHFYRLTLLATSFDRQARLIVQASFAQPGETQTRCSHPVYLDAGRLTYNQFVN